MAAGNQGECKQNLTVILQYFQIFGMNSKSNMSSSSSLRDFSVIQKLGEGSFASVYKVQRIDNQKCYAMKKVKIAQMKDKERDNALNEVRILASISHPNIINYKEAFFDDPTQSLCIVMELADAGDIQKRINQHLKNHSYFTESEIWQALIQMTKGLVALHEHNILHRDLKCANVFCTKDHKYKLGDLNVSKVAKRGMARTQTGTPYYTSPQVWKDRPYDSKCDIWSLGCVIYQMASLHPPFRANNLKQLYAKIQRGIFQRIPAFYSQSLYQVISLCLKVNPTSRISAEEILNHPKVLSNFPQSQKFIYQENKSHLIGTILCPRNLKSLKMALPGAKYQESPSKPAEMVRPRSVDGMQPQRRSVSSKNIEIPRVIQSPKQGQLKSKEIKYALMRRPSSDRHLLPMISKREASSQREMEKNSRNNSRLSRNNSVDSMRKRQDSNKSIDKKSRHDSIQEKGNNGNNFMQDISNKCKDIEERIKLIMNNRIQPRHQKVSNSFQRRYNLPELSSREKRDPSIKNRSRNNSIELQPQPKVGSYRNLKRVPSERQIIQDRSNQKIDRERSKRSLEKRNLPYRK